MTPISESAHNIKHDTDIHLLLERGREVVINYGAGQWKAVYWGSDDDGDIIAHQADGRWRFIHFNLRPVSDKMIVGDLLPLQEIHQIEKEVLAAQGGQPDAPR